MAVGVVAMAVVGAITSEGVAPTDLSYKRHGVATSESTAQRESDGVAQGQGAPEDSPAAARTDGPGRDGGGRGRPPGKGHDDRGWPRCKHPWPCGDGSEWPAGLDGPFEVGATEHIRIPVGEGLELDGVVIHPVLPDGVRSPVIMEATPYAGNTSTPADSPRWLVPVGMDAASAWGARDFVEAGYAYAVVSVLGTGGSDGCFDALGARDTSSLAAAVEWLAARPWSNGRVGMTGYSWAGGTPFAAALANPPSLKTIVPAAITTNLYTIRTTPQGAWADVPGSTFPPDWTSYTAAVSWAPPVQSAPADAGPGWAQRMPDRLCDDARAFALDKYPAAVTDDGTVPGFETRILTPRFPSIRSSVFVAHGLQDAGHGWQEDDVWSALANAPKRMLLGQWEHGFPVDANVQRSGLGDTWTGVARSWFDFWLKGIGEPPRVGAVDYEDNTGGWHTSASWPPKDAHEEALHLAGAKLQADGGEGAVRFVSAPAGGDFTFPPSCSPTTDTPPGLLFLSDPLPTGGLLSGNPVARLEVSSDQPGGVFGVGLFSLPGDGDPCTDRWLYGTNPDVHWISNGAIDLRYHEGNLTGRDLPPGRHVVRVDLSNLSHRIAPGERLGLWLGRSVAAPGQTSRHATATITVYGSSEIRLPLMEGSAGGSRPVGDMPPRPFAPG